MAANAPSRMRPAAALPLLVFVVGYAVQVALAFGPSHVRSPAAVVGQAILVGIPVVVGCLLGARAPGTPVGPALSWVGAAPAGVFAIEGWGATAPTAHPWPAAHVVATIEPGVWVWNLAGFVALCLVFPDGLLPGRRWRTLAWCAVAAGIVVNTAVALASVEQVGGKPRPALAAIAFASFGGLLVVLSSAVASIVVRYRRGNTIVRQQLRWLILGAGTVPVLLAAGWVAESLGASIGFAYAGFIIAMVILVPASVAVAVLRYDLYDIDRLLGSTIAWLLTSLASAAVFAALVFGATEAIGVNSPLSLIGATFVAAIILLPLHRSISNVVGRLVDHERTVILARVQSFVRQVRDGEAEPETTEAVMRSVLADPGLRLLVRPPGDPAGSYVDLAGNAVTVLSGATRVPLMTGTTEVGVVVLGAPTARRIRRARDVALQARLPIEVSRLRIELRAAVQDAQSSRARLALATAAERHRLARDLHDGAQQQIIAVGMRLRSVQRALDPGQHAYDDLEAAVIALTDTVADLRRLAHGLRPSRLEDGLAAALVALVADSPVPVNVTVADIETTEVIATTVYFVVAEALTNALKHAHATAIQVDVERRGEGIYLEISDDGIGGARTGFGLTSVRDRISSVGGEFSLVSTAGAGTLIKVRI
jgi:signal transduction histidine kinase